MINDHWWWSVPEFVEAQQDPGFQAWVETLSLGVELGEITFEDIIPGLPADMFSDEALLMAERAFLDRYPDRIALYDSPDKGWSFLKYLGQAYVEKLECRWVYQPQVAGKWEESPGPAIERPWPTNMLLPLVPILTSTVHWRHGGNWLFTFKNNREDYFEWKGSQGETTP